MAKERLALCKNNSTELCPVNCPLHQANGKVWEIFTLRVNMVLGLSGRKGFTVNDLVEMMQSLVNQNGHIEGLNLEIEVDKQNPNPLCLRN